MPTSLVTITPRVLPDLRLGRRLQRLVDALAARAEARLGQALPCWAERKAAYRFFAHAELTPETILAAARPAVVARVGKAAGVVLAIQDTTTLNFSHRPATVGLGPLGGTPAQGFEIHSCLAVDAETGVPLGLLAQQLWARDPAGVASKASHHQRLAAEKESKRWAETEASSLAGLPASVPVVSVADAEGDIYTWFTAARPAHAFLLVRVAQQRRQTQAGGSVRAAAQAAPVAGHYAVPLRAAPGRAARTAHCQVRWSPLTLRPPVSGRREPGRDQPVGLCVVLVEEVAPPAGGAPLQWLLLTSWPVAGWEDAARVVWWYTQRWLVERYHLVLKTGCQAEALQLREEGRLERAVAVYCLVAVQVLGLTYLAREQPNRPCTVALTEPEWQALCLVQQPGQPLPQAPPPLRQATRWVAMLGGFLGRTRDGEPGPLTIWRGLDRLRDLALGLQLARGLTPPLTYG